MASYTDIIPKFNPYIQQLPVEAMVKVGMEKQKRYDEGVQKIQSQIDNIAGIDIVHDADKAYLQSKLNELGNNLRTVAAGDFSNFQLVNSVGGMTNQVIKDPFVQNAVASTANHRKNMEQMDKDAAEGKLTPDNKWFYENQFSSYLKSPKAGQLFSGKYIKNYDIDKDILEMVKAAHGDEAEWEEQARNPDGSINADILVEKSKKGLLSPKLRNIVDTVFSKPQVQQQLMISGLYNYKDYTPQDLLKTQDVSLQALTDKAMKMREQYAVVSAVNSKDAADADKAIVAIDDQINNYREQYNRFVEKLNNNPESAKIELYSQNLKERYVSDFSWEANSQKSKVAPQFDVSIRRATYELSVAKEKFDQWIQKEQLDISRANLAIAQEDAKRKRLIAEGKLNPDGSAKVTFSLGAVDPAKAAATGSSSWKDESKALTNEQLDLQTKLIMSLPGYEDLYVMKDGQLVPNRDKYGDQGLLDKMGEALVALNKAHLNGTVNPNLRGDVQRYYDLASLTSQRAVEENAIEDKFRPLLNQFDKNVRSLPGMKDSFVVDYYAPKEVSESPKPRTMTVNKQDIFDYYLWKNLDSDKGGSAAKERIVSRHGEDGFFGLNRLLNQVYRNTPDNNLLYSLSEGIQNAITAIPNLKNSMNQRESQYRNLQTQRQYYYGTSNTAKPEDKLTVNQIFAAQVSALTGEQSGDYETLIKWLDATKPENLNNNLYDHYKGSDGKWYIQVRRNTGEGKFEYSEALSVPYDVVQKLGGNLDPNEQAFNDVFGGFLNIYGWDATAKDVKSKDAESTAVMRGPVGKYSVGYHLKKFGGGYVPYAYVRDSNGNILANGVQVDFSVYSKDKSLSPAQRKMFSDAQTIISPADMLPKLNMLDEHFFDLLLKNK